MNERIQELRHKAMDLTASQPSEEDNAFVIHTTYEEFLSMLIVQECIKAASNAKSLEAAAMIKQHFGLANPT